MSLSISTSLLNSQRNQCEFGTCLTQEVEFGGQREGVSVGDEGVIPSVRGLHVINQQLVGPGDMLPRVTKETTLIVTRSYVKKKKKRERGNK